MESENWIDQELTDLGASHRFRSLAPLPEAGGRITINGVPHLNFSSNDYLDFIRRPELREASARAVRDSGSGSGSSRLVTGDLTHHEALEEATARHKGYPAALLFGSGFLANIGTVTSLVGRGDTIVADRLVHASLIDAIKLSGAKLLRFHHNDAEHAKACLDRAGDGKVLLLTESVFSMDGDIAPLDELASLAQSRNAMFMVDEAHASGVFGPRGNGLLAERGLQDRVNISMSTFSKALGSYGGIVACSEPMRSLLINRARSFIYTTALPPSVCAASLRALHLLDEDPDLGAALLRRAELFRTALKQHGFDTGRSESQIIPVMIGENRDALELAAAMKREGILVSAIRPPTVPAGTARLRFSVTLAHSNEDLTHAAAVLAKTADALKLDVRHHGR